MKKKLLSIVAAALITVSATAQNKTNENSIGIHFGTKEYAGDLGYEMFRFDKVHAAFGVSYSRYINRSFDGMLSFSYGQMRFSKGARSFKTNLGDFKLEAKYKLNNGYILKEDAFIAPFVHAGIGNSFYSGSHVNGTVFKLGFPMGAGTMLNFNENFALSLNTTFTVMVDDKMDGVDNRDKSGNLTDRFLYSAIGAHYNFSTGKDTDGDGILDKNDECPEVAGTLENGGCPDTDGDGVIDKLDACPTEIGSAVLGGCPDTDGDGVADKDDTCPQVKGLANLKGCPDTDGDGIADSEDACPEIAGVAEFNGCIDTDKDGIADNLDTCPKVAGSKEMNGCPDTDKDGIADNLDKCPTVAGIAANKGCPEIKKEDAKVMEMAMKGLFFESGSAKIKASSLKVLDNIANVMNSNKAYNLMIEGHTDASGDEAKNLILSKDRAKAAKDYLIEKGIDAKRLTSEGYGITKPVADNNTAAGRAKNRRVEFNIKF
jgi:outer membrane protein OmpA-like peptidoglycan-associated protein